MINKYFKNQKNNSYNFIIYMVIGFALLFLGILLSIAIGAASIKFSDVISSIFEFDSGVIAHQTIRQIRIPRTIANILVGAGFAIAGSIMQGVTRNPLADSGLLGINSGAGLALAISFSFFPDMSYTKIILFSFVGASIGVGITYYISSSDNSDIRPDRLILAGTTVSLLFLALSQFVAITGNVGQQITYWNVGGVANVGFQELKFVTPWFLIATVASIIISPSVTILNLGEELAKGLGQRTKLIKIISIILVLILSSIAVTLVGPVGFVGLIIPHIVRFFVGDDYRFIIPTSGLFGAIFMLFADVFGRIINAPYETPLGIIFAIIGVPFFLYISRKERMGF